MRFRVILLIISILWTCNPPKENKTLQEAAKVHNQAMKIHQAVMPKIDELKSIAEKLKAQSDSLKKAQKPTKELDDFMGLINQNEKTMQDWMKNIVEVPGNEHHDHSAEGHQHNHDHHHSPKTEVSDEEMLAIQQESLKNIQLIQKTSEELISKSKKNLHN
jgi:hypothetical protein